MTNRRTLRTDAGRIWSAALRAVDPIQAVNSSVRRRGETLRIGTRRIALSDVEDVWVLGAGKAAAPMGHAIERILGKRLSGGILVTKYGHGLPLKKLDLVEAGHPLPDANSLAAGERVIRFAQEVVKPTDLVLCLLSGGGSALLAAPADGIKLEDKLECTRSLLHAGATIHEMNAVRKHLSSIKGGGLARLLASTPVICVILSDVVDDSLDTIASGPLVPDPTTFGECLEILRRLGVVEQVPRAVLRRFEAGAAGSISETPKTGDRIFDNKASVIAGNNTLACMAASTAARGLGYHTMVLTTRATGDTSELAGFHLNIAEEIVLHGRPLRQPACILSGGETTVRVTGNGLGGRNQHFVLSVAARLSRLPAPCLVASIGTDGTDGPTDAAGALADNSTLARSTRFGAGFLRDSLANHDAYHFFKRLGDLIITGPTRTNVMDLHVMLVGIPATGSKRKRSRRDL